MVKFERVPLLLGLVLVLTLVGAKASEPVCRQAEKFSRASFPEGFLWGTATAAFQVEGAVDEGCRGPSMWDTFTKKYPHRCQNHNADVAVDFYHRYKEDIKLMRDLNTDAFRLSIAWPRIFPHGRMSKGISKQGVQFYHDLIDELLKNKITPLVTVFHWDTPQDLEDEYGGFLSGNIVKDFTEYANFTFHEYGHKVKNWITFNEPWVFSRAGYDVGKKAPGRCSPYIQEWGKHCEDGRSGFEAYQVSHNLLLAHAYSVEAFRACKQCAGGKIGIAHSPAWFEPADLESVGAPIERVLDFILGWHLHPTTYGDYPQSMKDRIGHRLPKFTEAEKRILKNSADFVGMNYYTSVFGANMQNGDSKTPSWTTDSLVQWESKTVDGYKIGSKPAGGKLDVYSRGMRKLLKYIKDNYGDPEIMITENGYGEDLGDLHNDVATGTNDHNRKYYLQRHLLSLHEAICDDKMAGGVKEDEKNERIIRSLLKLPDNKRCINCNSLGPQYVCTTFWTFVCTNCSGIHREFTHRVKSISMAKFTSQEVSALKEGGNQHAKDIYFKGLDQQRQSAPDGSNVERLRDFIRQVYVNKRYTNEKNDDKPPRGPMGDSETRSSSGSRSPPYEDAYERRYSDRSSPGGMSPGFEQGNRKSPSRPEVLNDWRREDRFGGRKKPEEESHSPEQVKDLGSASPPIARPVREILGDSVIPLRVIEPPKPQVNRNSDSSVIAKVWLYHRHPTASSSSLTTANENPPEVKMETAMSLIDFDADPEPPAPSVAIQAPISATHQPAAQPASASNDNWASFDAAPITPSLNVSQPPPSGNSVDSLLSQLAAPSSGPVQTSTLPSGPAHLGHSTSQIFAPPPNGQSNEQPWNTGLSSNVQRSMSAPSLHPLQGVPSEVKPSGRTELPADLFTATYQSYHAAAPGWQAGPPHGMPYGLQQYNNTMPYQNVPQPARSMNPFDFSSEPPSVTRTETMFPSMASLQGALPPSGMMPSQGLHNHFSMPPQVSGHPSAMPPRYISPQIPGSMRPSSLRPIGNMGAPYDTQQTYQNFGSPFAANSSNPSFPSGGNPFG